MQDLAPMKLKAITKRGRKRDFVDLYFLLQFFTVKELLDLYKSWAGQEEIIHVVTSMTYFDDAENDEMSFMFDEKITWEAIKKDKWGGIKVFERIKFMPAQGLCYST